MHLEAGLDVPSLGPIEERVSEMALRFDNGNVILDVPESDGFVEVNHYHRIRDMVSDLLQLDPSWNDDYSVAIWSDVHPKMAAAVLEIVADDGLAPGRDIPEYDAEWVSLDSDRRAKYHECKVCRWNAVPDYRYFRFALEQDSATVFLPVCVNCRNDFYRLLDTAGHWREIIERLIDENA